MEYIMKTVAVCPWVTMMILWMDMVDTVYSVLQITKRSLIVACIFVHVYRHCPFTWKHEKHKPVGIYKDRLSHTCPNHKHKESYDKPLSGGGGGNYILFGKKKINLLLLFAHLCLWESIYPPPPPTNSRHDIKSFIVRGETYMPNP